jgi:FAD:protein FMN transferase
MSATPRSTRREFLKGTAAADALAEIAAPSDAACELPEPSRGTYLLKLSRRAMACQFEIILNAGQYADATETGLAALDLVDRLEDQLSIYRETSEVSRLNRQAAQQPIAVEPRLFALLQTGVAIHAQTHGAYDITAGPLSSAWGFTRRAGSIPAAAAIAAARDCVGSRYLELDPATHGVRFLKSGLGINLGSIGKGYALDRCAELLLAAGIHDFLLHGGNSSVLARGAHGALALDQGWSVGVRNPLRPDRRLGQLRLKDRALATSGSGTQFFVHEGRRFGHILDPRSGWPAEDVLSVSVLAPTAAEADALSTAFYVLGPEGAQDYCAGHPDVGAVMLCGGAREGSIERHWIALDQRDWSDLDAM